MSEFADTQGLLLSAYPELGAAGYCLLRVIDADRCREWLRAILGQVTFYEHRKDQLCLNIAFTRTGLQALGLQPLELDTFAIPFFEGMAVAHRSQLLGDRGEVPPLAMELGSAQSGGPGSSRVRRGFQKR